MTQFVYINQAPVVHAGLTGPQTGGWSYKLKPEPRDINHDDVEEAVGRDWKF